MVACSICCVKLKQCCRLMMKCLEAEELFAEMAREDYQRNLIVKQDHSQCFGGLVKTSVVSISIVDVGLTECVIVKEELPAVCESRDDIIEQMEEHQRDDIKQNRDIGYSDKGDISFLGGIQFEKDSEDDVPLMKFKTEVEEEQEVHEQKQRAIESNDIKQENTDIGYSDEEHISSLSIQIKEDSEDDVTLMKFKTEVAEEQELSEQKQRAMEINTPTIIVEEPVLHLRSTKLENSLPADQKTNQEADLKIDRATQNRTSKYIIKFKKPHECEICHYKFTKKSSLTDHIRIHTGEKPNKCGICQRSFSRKFDLTQHILTHTGEKPYKCDICQRSFSRKFHLTQHVLTHTGEKPHKCDICQRSFSRIGCLTVHIHSHTGNKPYKCDICRNSFSRKDHLTKHIRTHTGEKPFMCHKCQRNFSDKSTLTNHIRTHTGEKPYNCEICQRSFGHKVLLSNHIRTHTTEKHYKCDMCQNSFRQKAYLIKHIRTHTGEKPFKCDICQCSFSQNQYLKRHIRTHTGEKPYKCDICLSSFNKKHNLTSHIRKHIGVKPKV